MATTKTKRRDKIRRRVRRNIFGTAEKPRMTVYKSNKQIYVQLIDDNAGHTLVEASSSSVKDAQNVAKQEQAKKVGAMIAERAVAKGINNVVFDRNGYLYHGRVKALGDSAREGGLKF
jgi:large subunit ribosomal protein L18